MTDSLSLFLENKASLNALFDYAPIGICVISENNTIGLANPYLENLFGYSTDELSGKPLEMLIPEVVILRTHFTEDVDPAPAERDLTFWALRKDEHQFLVEVRFGPSNDQNLIVVFITDITQKALSDDKFKVIFYESPAAKTLSDLTTGKIVDTNDSFCQFSGYSREELIGKTPIELRLVDPEKRRDPINVVQTNGALINNEIVVSTKVSEQVVALVSTKQIEIVGRKFILSTFIDITEQKKATESLLVAKSILEDEATELKRLNEAGNRLWKINNMHDGLKEILESSIELTKADKGNIQLYRPDSQDLYIEVSNGFSQEFLDHFRAVNASNYSTCGIALKQRTQIVTADTEKEWTPEDAVVARKEAFRSVQSTPLLSQDGMPIGMISTHFKRVGMPPALLLGRMEFYALVAEAFVERIKNYETIQRHNYELEQKVAERTQALKYTLDQLQQSKDEVVRALANEKELSELKSRFITIASHEFRTPLTSILNSTTLIEKYPEEDQQDKRLRNLQRIRSSIRNMNSILDEFLSVGKLEEGKILFHPSWVNMDDLVSDAVAEMQNQLKSGQVIQTSLACSDSVWTDSSLMRMILINLLSNAIKYSDGETIIRIDSSWADGQLTLSVADQGIGISQEDQGHLFERFFRARNANGIAGTGLGLHIVGRYVELMGGWIRLESELNVGTTVTVWLPCSHLSEQH